jgi:hypothetical protein
MIFPAGKVGYFFSHDWRAKSDWKASINSILDQASVLSRLELRLARSTAAVPAAAARAVAKLRNP